MIDILFYIFAGLSVIGSLVVVTARNPIYSVLALIFTFFNSAGIFLLLGAELLAMLLVIVYVGAVAVLFLFVVMMLNVKVTALKDGMARYLPLGLLLAGAMFVELALALSVDIPAAGIASGGGEVENTRAIGRVLYTDYIALFQLAGLVLLVAMIGAIVLTHRKREGVRKQDIAQQVSRAPRKTVKMVKVESGKGI